MDLPSRLDERHLAVYRALPGDILDLTDLPSARARLAALWRSADPVAPHLGVTIEDRITSGSGGGSEVMVRLYRPASLAASAPALYWIHGGGLVLGDVSMDDDACASIAHELQILVVSVAYRLAPEAPFPQPLEDCYTGLRWLARSAPELRVDPAQIAVGGASAGGGLAAALCLLARDRNEVTPAFQLLVYPMLDDRNVTPSSLAIRDPKIWNREANIVGWNAYLDGRAGAEDVSPYAAPARAVDLSGLPPAYINVGDLDLFFDEDIAYAQQLNRSGVPVELHVYPGAFHGSNNFVSRSRLAERWTQDERDALRRALCD